MTRDRASQSTSSTGFFSGLCTALRHPVAIDDAAAEELAVALHHTRQQNVACGAIDCNKRANHDYSCCVDHRRHGDAQGKANLFTLFQVGEVANLAFHEKLLPALLVLAPILIGLPVDKAQAWV